VVSFTGSTATGRALAEKAGRHLKRIVLELGGKSPIIVLEDADLDLAVSAAAFGGFFHQGQICMAATRLLVEHSLADALASQLVEKLGTLKMGDPNDPQTAIGPITSPTQLAKIQAHVDDAVSKGAKVLAGGRSRGPYFEPTLLTNVTPQMRCYYEETFGPVVVLTPVKNADEAVRLANDTSFGLSAAIITGDPKRGMALAERLQSGMVHVNDSTVHDEPHAPFGGIKGSGSGTARRPRRRRGLHRDPLDQPADRAAPLPLRPMSAVDGVLFDLGGVVMDSPLHAIAATSATTGCPPMPSTAWWRPPARRAPGPGWSAAS
jgi:aldehyde dehydrogenase (NAD+)